jgi:CelD/BcsL family acetyltransferase involved in cellulose biosynthesis
MEVSYAIVEDHGRLARVEDAWTGLLERSLTDVPMLSPAWLLPWWRVFGAQEGRRLKVGLFYAGDRLIGLAPLLARRHSYRPGIPFRRLEALGSGEREEDETCSEYLAVVAEHGMERAVYTSLARALAEGAFGAWDELVLPAMDGSLPLPALLAESLRQQGLSASVEPAGVARYAALPATWDAYLRGLPRSSRYMILRVLRDFERWAGGDVEIRRARSLDELEEGKRTLRALHEERWSGAGAFASPRFRAFHDEVMPALLSRGALDLSWLVVRGRPLSAFYSLRWRGRVYVYQVGRTLAVPPEVRPGIVHHARAIQRAIEDGCSAYDLLQGLSVYKRQIARSETPLAVVRAVRSPALEALRRGAVAIVNTVKHWSP